MRGLSREARAIIDAARAAGAPSDADRARIRGKLKLRLGGGIAAASAATVAARTVAAAAEAGAGKAVITGLLTKAGAVVAVLGALAGGAALSREDAGGARLTAPARQGVEAIAVAAVRAAPPPSSAPDAPPAPEVIAAQPAPPPPRPAPPPRSAAASEPPAPSPAPDAPPAPPAPPAPEPRPLPDTGLDEEISLLARAQGALSSGQADRALALLDEHAAAHGEGAMGEERMAARVFALCALGRRDEARAEAQRFVAAAPRSPLAARVRAACAPGEAAAPKP
ncbi:MAG: hypothetical protein IT372_29815 [Polyangiaceae bacterium]|nr:hypothetical protein [Polyangiaceae bacterium]